MAISEPVEIGRVARARERYWMVTGVDVSDSDTTWVTLESLHDDNLGETLEILRERETHFEILPEEWLHDFDSLDSPEAFDSFLYSLQWQTQSLLPQETIRAPYFGSVSIREYQLEPVIKALASPRIHFLLADDVGLGKTIESGMILQELLLSGKARRILILCPASLRWQWKWEMEEKFGIDFRIIDRKAIVELRKEYGINVNPWLSFPRLITSYDFLKMEQPLQWFKLTQPVAPPASQSGFVSPFKQWDVLLLDEAHNCLPKPTKHYCQDSDRTRLIREISPMFEHRLFLTATPHNGKREAFIAFLELLDPYRFNRGEPYLDSEAFRKKLDAVMIRRMKRGPDAVKDPFGRPLFPERAIHAIEIVSREEEEEMYTLLNGYLHKRLYSQRVGSHSPSAPEFQSLEFALTILKKRALSSPLAFFRSLEVHLRTGGLPQNIGPQYLNRLNARYQEDQEDDTQKQDLEDALVETLSTGDRGSELSRLYHLTALQKDSADSKTAALLEWMNQTLRQGEQWNTERVVIFTEFLDTLHYLRQQFLSHGIEENRIILLYGGMADEEREAVKRSFETNPMHHPARILLATDAASEGINLQRYCRYLVHIEIPWNPIRLEQRMGRIDRYGQSRDVHIYHFVYQNREDSRFLRTIVEKTNQIQEDLQNLNPVLSEEIGKRMLGYRTASELPLFVNETLIKERIRAKIEVSVYRQRIEETRRKLSLTPEHIRLVLDNALILLQGEGLRKIENTGYDRITKLPERWADLTRFFPNNRLPITVAFDEASRDRRDEDAVFLHPSHPLLKRAMAFFRANLWSKRIDTNRNQSQRLNRVTLKAVPSTITSNPLVILYLKGAIQNEFSQVLIEEIVSMGFTFSEGLIVPVDPSFLAGIEHAFIKYKPDPKMGLTMKRLLQENLETLRHTVGEKEKTWTSEYLSQFQEYVKRETRDLESLIKERIREINAAIKPLQKLAQTLLFQEERSQAWEDAQRLLLRKEHLEAELKDIPTRISKKYRVKGAPRLQPIAYCFVLPM
ncbi:MAG TPA: DISARM system SNF2-like helicase DrmD [Thermotogota bacterium]|jgi:ERCC4-related helicase|nr:DISARM system SNF2-like helicase DrmD [Thermotogota bacterium]OQC32663.1 MAG: RNA polymerase-associated protein RapA [Thermotogota bacterium ADurb.Bin062]HNW47790.1 DISARM system SNF2-like helicase DrmD [Thermotogota bacterium]HNY83010.1 DISARM system SNF2-like helicase DrmD [Thermotogota bacterium]HOD92075.1 DISARM system SNF2-like helicase DrmD [Thermotogota bacterium]